MKYYSYDNDFIFIDQGKCQVDPMESKIQGKNIYLVPAMATLEAPPKMEPNQFAKWSSRTGWTLHNEIKEDQEEVTEGEPVE